MANKINKVSICIPAHNEEVCIDSALTHTMRALKALSSYRTEVLICANACTDGTVYKINEWAELNNLSVKKYDIDNAIPSEDKAGANNPDFCLTNLVTKTPGKPNAFNNLCSFATGDILIFIDADVIIHPDAFGFLVQALTAAPGIKAAGGIVLAPRLKSFNLLYKRMAIKMKEFATKKSPYLNGPLYAIRKDAVRPIPGEIIHEDAYLNMMLGVKQIVKVMEALAFQVPPNTYKDYFKRQVRNNLSDLQMKQLYATQYLSFRENTRDNRTREGREACLTKTENILKRLFFLQAWITKILDGIAKKQARKMFDKNIVRWYTIPSTKHK
ncbi:MAG: glycosyltransferase [Nitrospiraceae bacterium]|nr:MAG: glycosyltransferase [Nitrospiraceae bacterium]